MARCRLRVPSGGRRGLVRPAGLGHAPPAGLMRPRGAQTPPGRPGCHRRGLGTSRPGSPVRRGDGKAERTCLKQLIAADPGDTAALERLASLAIAEGSAERAAELRRRKADIDDARARYRCAAGAFRDAPDPAELARLAETLGRRFEAQGWWTLVAPRSAEASAALVRQGAATSTAPAREFASLLSEVAKSPVGARPDRSSPGAPICFRDDAETVGLRFTYDNGPSPARQLPETMSGGVALLDYDGDGWLDVYCVQGGPSRPREDRSPRRRATACSTIAATARLRMRPVPRGSPRCRAATGMASRWATTTMTAMPTCSSPAGGLRAIPQPGRRHVRGRDASAPVSAVTATGRPRRRSPIWTATATSTSMSATTWSGMPRTRRRAACRPTPRL